MRCWLLQLYAMLPPSVLRHPVLSITLQQLENEATARHRAHHENVQLENWLTETRTAEGNPRNLVSELTIFVGLTNLKLKVRILTFICIVTSQIDAWRPVNA